MDELEALGAPEEARRATAMAALLAHDQLREEQRCGRALCGFDEPPPPFPPTFKRVRVKDVEREADDEEAADDEARASRDSV